MGTIIKRIEMRGSKGRKEVEVLFDTGASMSFVRRSVAEEIGMIDKLPEPMRFETAETGKYIVAEEAVRLEFFLDGEWLSDDFLVIQDGVLSEECIIGAATMQKWRIVIDMERETVYSARAVKKHMLK